MLDYHYQNMFDYRNKWFCSKLTDKAFNVYATVYYDKTCEDAPFINEELFDKIKFPCEEDENNSKIKLNLKEIKPLIDLALDFSNCSLPKIPNDNYYGGENLKKPKFKTFETSGIKKFVESSLKDSKFYDKIFSKNENWNFFLDSFTINNCGSGYTCPIKTIAVFIHDEKELNQQDLDLLKNEFHFENDLISFIEQQSKNSSNEENFEIKEKEFDVLQYINQEVPNEGSIVFYEFDTMKQRLVGRNLKLLTWFCIPVETEKYFDFTKLVHFGRHVIVKPTNSNRRNSYDKNIDFKSIHFFGGVVHV